MNGSSLSSLRKSLAVWSCHGVLRIRKQFTVAFQLTAVGEESELPNLVSRSDFLVLLGNNAGSYAPVGIDGGLKKSRAYQVCYCTWRRRQQLGSRQNTTWQGTIETSRRLGIRLLRCIRLMSNRISHLLEICEELTRARQSRLEGLTVPEPAFCPPDHRGRVVPTNEWLIPFEDFTHFPDCTGELAQPARPVSAR